MKQSSKAAGPIEDAVLAHHPTPSVMYEAGALDRELAADQRSWKALLRSIESFSAHYPSVLLHSPAAIMALGNACLEGVREAPGLTLQKQSSSLLAGLLAGIVDEVNREGADRIPNQVPEVVNALILEASRTESLWVKHGHLVPALLEFGKQILKVGDSDQPELWYALLAPLTGLLLRMLQVQIEGEPAYDGRWDASDQAEKFQVKLLYPVHQDRIRADLNWLKERERELAAGSPPIDIFLEIASFSHRDEREQAWGAYFAALADSIQTGKLLGENLRQLCFGIAYWIEQASDLRLLSKLARILRNSAPSAAAGNGLTGLSTALDTFGRTIIGLLEREAGRGEVDAAFEDLRVVVAEVINRLLELADKKVAADAVQLGIRLRTGPLTGDPVSLEDTVWRINLAGNHPEVAEGILQSLVAGFSLEDVLLRDDRNMLGHSLASMLGRGWDRNLLFLVRAAIRMTPLSPFHLGGPSTRAHLLALDPENQKGFYLHDLREKVLSRSGPENQIWIEKVLQFWRSGSPEYLDNLASPRSLNNLPAWEKNEHLDHIRELLENLSRHVPVTDKIGVGWLARMPDAYYQASTMAKVAGFPGCSEKAYLLLEHLLNIYRALVEKYGKSQEQVRAVEPQTQNMLERSQSLLESRRLLLDKLFCQGGLSGLDPSERLEAFGHEMALVEEEDRLLEDLATRGLAILDRGKRKTAEIVVGHMLVNASLSGLGPEELIEVARVLEQGRVDESESLRLLRRAAGLLASTRNHLAERLQPQVEDSARRLMENALARPASSYRGLLDTHRHRGVESVAVELGEVLIDDLLSADGGFLVLENFVHRLMHMLEQY